MLMRSMRMKIVVVTSSPGSSRNNLANNFLE